MDDQLKATAFLSEIAVSWVYMNTQYANMLDMIILQSCIILKANKTFFISLIKDNFTFLRNWPLCGGGILP